MGKLLCSNCKRECFSELFGTYLLVFIGPASVIATSSVSSLSNIESLVLIALTFGGTVGGVILFFGEHSGAIINPALSVSAVLSGNLRADFLLPYLFSQITGGLGAGLTLKFLFSSFDSTDLGSTKLAPGIDPAVAIIIEAVGTFFLAASALIAANRLTHDRHRGIFVGTTLFFLILAIGPLTGASFNPARSLGPALASLYLNNLYVYLIGPVIGAIVAGLLFRSVKAVERKNSIRVRA